MSILSDRGRRCERRVSGDAGTLLGQLADALDERDEALRRLMEWGGGSGPGVLGWDGTIVAGVRDWIRKGMPYPGLPELPEWEKKRRADLIKS